MSVLRRREPAAWPVFLLRTEQDRLLARADYVEDVLDRCGSLRPLLYLPEDQVRHVELTDSLHRWPPSRWWSMSWFNQCQTLGCPRPYRTRVPGDTVISPALGVPAASWTSSLASIVAERAERMEGSGARGGVDGGLVH